MKRSVLILALAVGCPVVAACRAAAPSTTSNRSSASADDVARWESRAADVTIVRDDWGIPHIYGATDADAVFGTVYAQAEDDFKRVELNYLNAMGRLAEAEGEEEIYRDLRMKLFIQPEELMRQYQESPPWLRDLMDAFADGLNYYLHTHPEVEPRVIDRFEPWMALSFTEGSIGGDIERVSLVDLEEFYGASAEEQLDRAAFRSSEDTGGLAERKASRSIEPRLTAAGASSDAEALAGTALPTEPGGSNGFAIAPSNSATDNALLLINPHTSFYFRAELQMVSQEGLNAYGAVTWGQFFVYQGFNERAGWMHTSTGADAIDEYVESVVDRQSDLFYRVGEEERPLRSSTVTVPYRDGPDTSERTFTVFHTHRGPIVRAEDGGWVSVRLMNNPVAALTQSYSRTKASNYDEYVESMRNHTNSSNNTVYADADGTIAYFHANFVPVRDERFDWTGPVDGSDPATEWQGVHEVEDSPLLKNPSTGWLQNTNNWPWSAAAASSPRRQDFPSYMERFGENPRGLHAIRVLEGKTDFTLQSLMDAAYDSYLIGFEDLIPALTRAYDEAPESSAFKTSLAEPIDELRKWDLRFGVESIPTSLAVFWGDELWSRVSGAAREAGVDVYEWMANRTTAEERLGALAEAVEKLERDFGDWRTPWGDINRFQRLTGDIVQPFDDAEPSIPVAFASSRWGSLAAYGQRTFNDTKRIYGTRGNSFVAVVEFGDSVRARAITAGGQNGDPASPHFNDQAVRYSTGDLREVYFYREQLQGHIEREYQPGG